MAQKRKIKLKPGFRKILSIIGIIMGVILIVFIAYRSNISDLKSLGYSEKASKNIFFSMKKKEVMMIGKNKTLNAAFESDDYKEKNFTSYTKIKYQNHKNLIKNINSLIKKGYSNDEISTILSHGEDKDVSEFAKLEKVKYLDEFYTYDFAKIKYYDRYSKYLDESSEDEETTVVHVNLDLDKADYEDAKKVNKFSFDMLVNKHHYLDSKFVPDNLITISSDYSSDKMKGNKTAVNAAIEMIKAAKKEDYNLIINSAYRSYKEQEEVMNTYLGLYGESYVEKYVLKPGFSEHQTGLGFDFGSTDTKVFVQSDEYKWMEDNCYLYGFIHRFKSNYEDITGIKTEAWHYRYVGKKIAKYLYENDMTLEEYYVRFLDKD